MCSKTLVIYKRLSIGRTENSQNSSTRVRTENLKFYKHLPIITPTLHKLRAGLKLAEKRTAARVRAALSVEQEVGDRVAAATALVLHGHQQVGEAVQVDVTHPRGHQLQHVCV